MFPTEVRLRRPSRLAQRQRPLVRIVLAATLVSGAVVGLAGSTAAAGVSAPSSCSAPVASTTVLGKVLGIQIADARCGWSSTTSSYTSERFTPTLDAKNNVLSTTYAGMSNGSAYRMEVPKHWKGSLVLFAHGYRGNGTTVFVDSPELRTYYIQHGYAWAASSYQANGYDVAQGVLDTHALLALFPAVTGKSPKERIMTGLSMGGQITAVEIEQYRHTFAAAMPYCGVIGGNSLFNYFTDANVTAAALTNVKISYPMSLSAGLAYTSTYASQVASELTKLAPAYPANHSLATSALTPTGVQWRDTVEQRSGGTRPGFAGSFAFWGAFGFAPLTSAPFLFGVYPGLTGGTIGQAVGNVAGNAHTVYRFDQRENLTPAERLLNRTVLRVAPTERSSFRINYYSSGPLAGTPEGIPDVQGNPGIPVLSIHGIGDLFVPFSMEQVYAQRVAEHDQSNLFVSRAIRAVNHCSYTEKELSSGFAALVSWAHSDWADGHGRPAGDEVLDPEEVSSPNFGCTFTDQTPGVHPTWAAVGNPACPKPSRDLDRRG